jgi:hypothetical protein
LLPTIKYYQWYLKALKDYMAARELNHISDKSIVLCKQVFWSACFILHSNGQRLLFNNGAGKQFLIKKQLVNKADAIIVLEVVRI